MRREPTLQNPLTLPRVLEPSATYWRLIEGFCCGAAVVNRVVSRAAAKPTAKADPAVRCHRIHRQALRVFSCACVRPRMCRDVPTLGKRRRGALVVARRSPNVAFSAFRKRHLPPVRTAWFRAVRSDTLTPESRSSRHCSRDPDRIHSKGWHPYAFRLFA